MNLYVNTGLPGTREFSESLFLRNERVGLDDFSSFFPALKYYDLHNLFVSNHVLRSFLES